MIPILPRSYFLSSRDTRKIIDKTYYSYGSELTWEEKSSLVSFVNVVLTFKNIFGAGQNYSEHVPLVHELSGGNIRANIMKLPNDVVPPLMYVEGQMTIVNVRPRTETFVCAYSTSRTDGGLKIKGWTKIVNVRRPQIGDRWISMLHNGDGGFFLFYAILPKRKE